MLSLLTTELSSWVLFIVGVIAASVLAAPVAQRARPDEPAKVPSWIPYLGHIWSFMFDFGAVVKLATEYGRQTGGPVSLLLGGTRICFVTKAEDSQLIHKNAVHFNHDRFLSMTARQFGVSRRGVKILWPDESTSSKGLKNIMALVRRELTALRKPDGIPVNILQKVSKACEWDHIPPRAIVEEDDGGRIVSLSRWVRDAFVLASTEALFGQSMLELSPNLIRDFYKFDDRSWMVLYGIPQPISSNMRFALNRVQQALVKYLALPAEERQDGSRFMRRLELDVEEQNLEPRDVATVLSLIFWGFNTNGWKACFWCLCYIVSDASLLSIVRDEVAPVVAKNSSKDQLAMDLRSCKVLGGVYKEALRVSASTVSARESLTENILSGKKVKAGTNLLITYRSMLRDTNRFGQDADIFAWDRFLREDGLDKQPWFTPYGDGVGQCPGRWLAQMEIMSMVALVVTRFDIEKVDKQAFPKLDTKTPSLGVMGPCAGSDMLIRIAKRSC